MVVSEQEGGDCGNGGALFTNPTVISPRISFSHDFVDTVHHELGSYKEAPVPSNFEFSVKNYSMIHADEIFFKGMLVPLSDDLEFQSRKTTLKDELLMGDDDDDLSDEGRLNISGFRGGSGRWTERWRLKKSHHLQLESKKGGKRGGSVDGMLLETVVEEKTG